MKKLTPLAPLLVVGVYIVGTLVLDHLHFKESTSLNRKAASRESIDKLLDALNEQRIEVTFKDIVKNY